MGVGVAWWKLRVGLQVTSRALSAGRRTQDVVQSDRFPVVLNVFVSVYVSSAHTVCIYSEC